MLPKRLLLTAEGDPTPGAGDPGAPPAAAPPATAPASANGAPWYAPAETLKASDPEIWTSFEKGVQSGNHKDFPTFVKHAVSLEKRLGNAVTLPGKDAKAPDVEKWGKDLGEKVKPHGFALVKAQDAPPATSDSYNLTLDAIPEPLRSADTIKSVQQWAFKHGLSNAALNELVDIENKRYQETVKPVIELDRQKVQQEFDAWSQTEGKEPKAMAAYGGAWLAKNINENEMQLLEKSGLADHPTILKLIAKAGMDTGEDISIIEGTGAPDGDAEFNEVLRMTSDPKHPDYKLWMSGNTQDPKRQALQERYDNAFRRKYGSGELK